MIVIVMTVAIATIILVVAVAVASAAIVVILVLAVVMSVVVPEFFAGFMTTELAFPSAMTSPVGALTAHWVWAVVAEMRIVVVVDVAAETYRTMKPGAGTKEDPT
jgi:hypothetical protein